MTTAFDLEIDFENYAVPEDRVTSIREEISQIKARTWIGTLADWIHAEGQVYVPHGEQAEMSGADLALTVKRIAWADQNSENSEHPLKNLEIISDGIETELRITGKKFLSFQKLPKGDDFLISHYDTNLLNDFVALEPELQENLKLFSKAKADKQKAFQDKFKKQQ